VGRQEKGYFIKYIRQQVIRYQTSEIRLFLSKSSLDLPGRSVKDPEGFLAGLLRDWGKLTAKGKICIKQEEIE
jgi:hypothetical protein